MIELYGMGSPNVLKIAIMLEEVALPWRGHYVNVFGAEQYAAEFLALSPNNKVPAIVDTEGPAGAPFAVFESGAILVYLAEKTGSLLSEDPAARSTEMQWLIMQTSTVGPMFGQYAHFLLYAPKGDDYPRDRYRTEMHRILGVLERRLGEAPYLGGCAYSIADVAVFPWIRTVATMFPPFGRKPLAEALADHPALLRWFLDVAARPAVGRGVNRLAAMTQDRPGLREAAPDDIDRFVGRGRYTRA